MPILPLLARALLNVFPKIELAGGGVSRMGFYYLFCFNEHFAEDELQHVEEHVNSLLRSEISVAVKEMVPKNAAQFFKARRQQILAAECESKNTGLVQLYQVGDQLTDLVAEGDECTGKKVTLLQCIREGRFYKIIGIAGENQTELKEKKARSKSFEKKDFRFFGPKEAYVLDVEGQWVWLPKGVNAWNLVKKQLIEALYLEGYQEIIGLNDLKTSDQKKIALPKLFEWGDELSCQEFGKDKESAISSLHFIDKISKIFGLRCRWILSKNGLRTEDLGEIKRFIEKTASFTLQFEWIDCYDFPWRGGWMQFKMESNEESVLRWSPIGSMEELVALAIEDKNERNGDRSIP